MEEFIKIGQRIKDLRIEKGLTQEELALKLGYTSRSTINKIEKGLIDIPQSKLWLLSKELGTNPPYLLGWQNETNKLLSNKIIIEYKTGQQLQQDITEEQTKEIENILKLGKNQND